MSTDNPQEIDNFELTNFFPYLVRVYYRAVSEAVSATYTEKFGLSVSEWRAMAVLGSCKALSASQIVELSSLDKVSVSRAIKGLQAHGFLKRDIDNDDKRRAVLRLTAQGRKVFRRLVPLVKAREALCLAGLTETERDVLISLMERVRLNAENLADPRQHKSEDNKIGR